ncbi:MAG: hypothetical protein KJS95_08360 [Gammaproteobacteria bacterium]|nr:hypothetical protein [Gammaproteobacteria bacterium]
MARALPRTARHDLIVEISGAGDKLRFATCLLWSRTWRCAHWTAVAPARIGCAVMAAGCAQLELRALPEGAYAAVVLLLAAPDDASRRRVLGVDVVAAAASQGASLAQILRDPTPATFLLSGETTLQVALQPLIALQRTAPAQLGGERT